MIFSISIICNHAKEQSLGYSKLPKSIYVLQIIYVHEFCAESVYKIVINNIIKSDINKNEITSF